jgi:hypothetical protein
MRSIFLASLLLLIALPCRGEGHPVCPPPMEQPSAEQLQAAAQTARDRGFLWRIAKDGHTSYLYGTIHVGKLDWAMPGPSLQGALQATDTMALELDMLDPKVQRELADAVANMPAVPLPPSLEKRLRHTAETGCVSYAAIAKLAPALQIVTLTLNLARYDGLESAYAADIVLAGIGHAANKTVVSLETVESQMSLLRTQDPQEARDIVADGLDQLDSGVARRVLARLAQAWAESNHDEMTHYDAWCQCRETESARDMMRRILDDRNPLLADRIDALHRSGKRVLAAVGSLHMFGAGSLPEILRGRGYAVERVEFARK